MRREGIVDLLQLGGEEERHGKDDGFYKVKRVLLPLF